MLDQVPAKVAVFSLEFGDSEKNLQTINPCRFDKSINEKAQAGRAGHGLSRVRIEVMA
jgi:hypothetical protein